MKLLYKTSSVYLGILLVLIGCNVISTKKANEIDKNTNNRGQKYLALSKYAPHYDPKELGVTAAELKKISVGSNFLNFVQILDSEKGSLYYYEITENKNDDLVQYGFSDIETILLPVLPQGTYNIQIRSCVWEDTARDRAENLKLSRKLAELGQSLFCGPGKSNIPMVQEVNIDGDLGKLGFSHKLRAKAYKIYDLLNIIQHKESLNQFDPYIISTLSLGREMFANLLMSYYYDDLRKTFSNDSITNEKYSLQLSKLSKAEHSYAHILPIIYLGSLHQSMYIPKRSDLKQEVGLNLASSLTDTDEYLRRKYKLDRYREIYLDKVDQSIRELESVQEFLDKVSDRLKNDVEIKASDKIFNLLPENFKDQYSIESVNKMDIITVRQERTVILDRLRKIDLSRIDLSLVILEIENLFLKQYYTPQEKTFLDYDQHVTGTTKERLNAIDQIDQIKNQKLPLSPEDTNKLIQLEERIKSIDYRRDRLEQIIYGFYRENEVKSINVDTASIDSLEKTKIYNEYRIEFLKRRNLDGLTGLGATELRYRLALQQSDPKKFSQAYHDYMGMLLHDISNPDPEIRVLPSRYQMIKTDADLYLRKFTGKMSYSYALARKVYSDAGFLKSINALARVLALVDDNNISLLKTAIHEFNQSKWNNN